MFTFSQTWPMWPHLSCFLADTRCSGTTQKMFWNHIVLSLSDLVLGVLVLLSGKLYFKTNFWVLGGLLAVKVLIFLGLCSKLILIIMYWKIYVNIYTHTTHRSIVCNFKKKKKTRINPDFHQYGIDWIKLWFIHMWNHYVVMKKNKENLTILPCNEF